MQPPTFPGEFNLADYYLFDRLEDGLGDKTAIRYGELGYTYGEIAERTVALSNYLRSLDIDRGQRVYIVLPDTPPFAWSFFATLAHGAVVTMGNPAAPVDGLAHVIDYVQAAVLITVPSVVGALSEELQTNPWIKSVLLVPETRTGEDPEAPAEIIQSPAIGQVDVRMLVDAVAMGREQRYEPLPKLRRDDQAIWLFTSGSTGTPKAAIHTHRDFAYNTELYGKRTVGYQRDDVTVSVPRLFFGYSTGTNLMFPFAVGATTCLFSERPTPETLAQAIAMYRPSVVTNVPTMMAKLIEHDDTRRAAGNPPLDFSCIRFHLSAGEALPPTLLERFTSRFGNDVYDGIGSAEMFHIYASNRPGDIKPGSLGKAVDGYEIRILPADADGPGADEVPTGETGVMWVRGDSVAVAYHQDRDKSWQTFYGHWCRTGDLFSRDDEGYLWFHGRADSLFKCGGIWVAPMEIEECLTQHEAVAMAVVIPAKDSGLDKPKAFVVLRESASTLDAEALREELQAHVRGRLSKHKYPRWVVFTEDLPRNDRGKIDRKSLIEREKRGANPWA